MCQLGVMVARGGEKELCASFSASFQLLRRRLSRDVAAPRVKGAEFRSWNLLTLHRHSCCPKCVEGFPCVRLEITVVGAAFAVALSLGRSRTFFVRSTKPSPCREAP